MAGLYFALVIVKNSLDDIHEALMSSIEFREKNFKALTDNLSSQIFNARKENREGQKLLSDIVKSVTFKNIQALSENTLELQRILTALNKSLALMKNNNAEISKLNDQIKILTEIKDVLNKLNVSVKNKILPEIKKISDAPKPEEELDTPGIMNKLNGILRTLQKIESNNKI